MSTNPRSFLLSPLGKKYLMALTGAYLVTFLIIHLVGNLSLLVGTDGKAFNEYSEMMAHNPLIRVASIVGFLLIAMHIIDGIVVTMGNRKARSVRYAVSSGNANSSFVARNMAPLGMILFVFLVLHLRTFWFVYKFDLESLPLVRYGVDTLPNRYLVVQEAFSQAWYVAIYLIAMVVVGMHAKHGVYSMTQSLGLHHPKYTPAVKLIGVLYAVIIPIAFALIPVVIFFRQ